MNRVMRRRNKIQGFKKKIIVHPLLFKAFSSYFEVDDAEKAAVYKECCALILDAHKGTANTNKKNGDERCNKPNSEQISVNKHLLGKDPHVKSLVKSIPPRILLSSDGIRQTHKLQMFNIIDKKYLFNFGENISLMDEFQCPTSFTDDDLIRMVPNFRKLRSLAFFRCKNISNEALKHVAQNWPEDKVKLKELIMYECDKISDEGLHPLLASCKDIKTLFLSGTKLSPYFLGIVGATCQSIRKLVLGVKGNLWERNITKIQNVTNDGILAIAKGCALLRNLNLNHCEQVTDQTLRHLAQHCRDLKSLEIYGCTKISVDGVIEAVRDRIQQNTSDEKFTTWKTITSDLEHTNVRWDKWQEFNKEVKDKKKKTFLHCPNPPRCFNADSFVPTFKASIISF